MELWTYEPIRIRIGYDPPDSHISWLLWIQQDREGNRLDKFWAGRVKLQDDAVVTAHAVFYNACQKLQSSLGWDGQTDPLF